MFKWQRLASSATGHIPTTTQQRLQQHLLTTKTRTPSPDTIMALSICVGLVGLLAEAYNRTELHPSNVDAPHHCRCMETSALIQPHHVKELQQRGIVVLPAALSKDQVHAARRGIENYMKQKNVVMEASGNDVDVRQDCILWIQDEVNTNMKRSYTSSSFAIRKNCVDDENDDIVSEHLMYCVRFIRGVEQALQDAGYNGDGVSRLSTSATATNATTTATLPRSLRRHVVVPRPCQLALYPGDSKASYARHLDACTSTVFELGLLEWWRLSDYRQRVTTVILYLNEPDRQESDGGMLRCWANPKDREESFDIVPKGGTLVIFQSDLVEHMVLPSSVDRYALTNWVSETGS